VKTYCENGKPNEGLGHNKYRNIFRTPLEHVVTILEKIVCLHIFSSAFQKYRSQRIFIDHWNIMCYVWDRPAYLLLKCSYKVFSTTSEIISTIYIESDINILLNSPTYSFKQYIIQQVANIQLGVADCSYSGSPSFSARVRIEAVYRDTRLNRVLTSIFVR